MDGETLNIKRITEGDSSGGAVAAAKKYGACTIYGGATVNFLGDATNTNSGVKMSPTTPDATVSKGCNLTFDMSNGKDIVINNSIGSLNASYAWTINNVYGNINTINGWNAGAGRMARIQTNYAYDTPFAAIAVSSNRCNAAPVVNNVVTSPFGVNGFMFIIPVQSIDYAVDLRNNKMDNTGLSTGTYGFLNGIGKLTTGGSLDLSGCTWVHPATSVARFILLASGGTQYTGSFKIAFADIRPTTVLPTGLTFYDPGTDGELWFTISNLASYANADVIKIYNAAGDAEMGATSKARYAARAFGAGAFAGGYGIVPGLTNGTLYTLYAKATSDNNTFSTATATATGTPTLAATDAAFLALEAGRNTDMAASKVELLYDYTTRGTARQGTVVPEAHTADEVLKSAGGNYNDDNLIPGNILSGVEFGLDQEGSLPSSGGGSLAGKLNKLLKYLKNKEVILEEGGVYSLVTYEDNGTTEMRRCVLKTFEGANIASLVGTTTPAQREMSSVDEAVSPIVGCLREKIDKLVSFESNKMIHAEIPAGSGEYFRVIYAASGGAIIMKQRLRTFDGGEIGSLHDSGEPNQRMKSEV